MEAVAFLQFHPTILSRFLEKPVQLVVLGLGYKRTEIYEAAQKTKFQYCHQRKDIWPRLQ